MTVGYLTSQYPAVSHTFIRREIAALRAAGIPIRTYSVRPPEPASANEVDEAERTGTFTILDQGAGTIVAANIRALLRSPKRYLGTLRLGLRHRVPGIRALLWSLFHVAEAMVLAELLRRDGVTRLHNHFANSAASVGMLAANYLRLRWSLTLHGISEFDYPAGLLLPAKLERAEFAACVSYFGMAQAMRITTPDLWPRLSLVRCGIDPQDLPKPHREGAPGVPFELVCVGRLSPEKGHAGLLFALAALVGKGLPIRLTLVGDGPERERLHAQAREIGIADDVVFAGRLDEASTLRVIARSDGLVLASFMEGLPIVLMEAMALGVPVIASRVAGIPELVEHGKSGLLFSPGDWSSLQQTIETLCNDAGLRQRLAEEAQRRVADEFTYPRAAQPLRMLFGESGND